MVRRNFRLVYMVPVGIDEIIKERIVRTFQKGLSVDQIKKNVFKVERSLGHWPLEFSEMQSDEV